MDEAGILPEPDLQEQEEPIGEEDVGNLDAFSDFLETLDLDDFEDTERDD